jgi:hypothetical protein
MIRLTQEILELVPDARQVREVLLAYGWTPMRKSGEAETFVRYHREIVIWYRGDVPSKSQVYQMDGARLVALPPRNPSFVVLDLDR